MNSGGGALSIVAASRGYRPGEAVRVRITLADPNARRWGFHLTARSGADNLETAGRFAPLPGDDSTQALSQGETITHTLEGTRDQQTVSASWEVLWTPPSTVSGPVTFYASGNAANGDGDNWGDDQIYTTMLRIPAAGSLDELDSVVTGIPTAPGWSHRLVLFRASAEPATVTLGSEGTTLVQPWQVVEREWAKHDGFVEAALPEHTWLEVHSVHPELGQSVRRAEKKSGLARAWLLRQSPLGLVHLGDGVASYTITWRDSSGNILAQEPIRVPAREPFRLEPPSGAASVAASGEGAPFAFHEFGVME